MENQSQAGILCDRALISTLINGLLQKYMTEVTYLTLFLIIGCHSIVLPNVFRDL